MLSLLTFCLHQPSPGYFSGLNSHSFSQDWKAWSCHLSVTVHAWVHPVSPHLWAHQEVHCAHFLFQVALSIFSVLVLYYFARSSSDSIPCFPCSSQVSLQVISWSFHPVLKLRHWQFWEPTFVVLSLTAISGSQSAICANCAYIKASCCVSPRR